MKRNPKALAPVVKLLRDLREWSDIEGSLHPYGTSEKQIWREVGEWADGAAAQMKLNLNEPRTNAERLKRQGEIFNHDGKCGKIVL
jgi:hypothetical protein